MSTQDLPLPLILEAALLAAGEPLTVDRMLALFPENTLSKTDILNALHELTDMHAERPTVLMQLASGYCFRVRETYAPYVTRLWAERTPRYSRALLETLALIAYRQPLSRGDIEEVRGVTVSTVLIKTLQDRGWIEVVGHREVPGRPALFGTTKAFLDYFHLKSLSDLPTIAESLDLERQASNLALDLESNGEDAEVAEKTAEETEMA